jgi:hypothetical protein
MKFESRTLQILKNFSTLNPSLQFKQGSVISTVTPNKTVMAKASIKEQIPATFAIYELSKFLSVLSLFDNPTITLDEKFLLIGDGKQSVQYTFANPDNIVVPSNRDIALPSIDITFKLTASVLQSVLKAMAVLGLPEIAVTGKDGKLYVQAINVKNSASDKFSVQIESDYNINANATFSMVFLADNMKIILDDYDVSISSRGIAHFKGKDIEYWVATESSSTYTS